MNRENIARRVQIATKHEDFTSNQIEIEGQTNKGDGYSGDVNFVKVTGTTRDGRSKILNLVIKSSKNDEKLREKIPIAEAYGKEIYIYEKVRPIFENFLHEKGVKEVIDFLPRCYATEITDNSEALIFENLRTQGFRLWDRARPVTYDHAKLVLEAYGKWHALSMALKTQKPEVFRDLTKDNVNMFSHLIGKMKFDTPMAQGFAGARDSIFRADETEFLKHLQYSTSDVKYALSDMYFEDPEHHVILHGDCWNSNFLYKFSEDETKPSEVRILDWQCSGLGSVAFDLSHYIYCCVDNGKFEDVEEMLKIYYRALSKYLSLLGCDPEAVFSFGKLLEQWKKFSRFGLFVSSWVIRICLMKEDELPDLSEADTENAFTEDVTLRGSSDEAFLKRVRNNFVHYVKNHRCT